MDKYACRYAAAVETNGVRVELIASKNMQEMIEPLLQHWQENVGEGRLPKHVYYFRDGVSEGQYQQVLQQEVADIRQIINKKGQFDPTHNVSESLAKYIDHANWRCRRNSRLLSQRSVIIFASSHHAGLLRTGTETRCLVPWLSGM